MDIDKLQKTLNSIDKRLYKLEKVAFLHFVRICIIKEENMEIGDIPSIITEYSDIYDRIKHKYDYNISK